MTQWLDELERLAKLRGTALSEEQYQAAVNKLLGEGTARPPSEDRSRPERVEICEVKLKEIKKTFGTDYVFQAIASGPTGLQVVAQTGVLRHGYADKRFDAEIASLTNRMLQAGWESLPSVFVDGSTSLPRFQRRVQS